MRRKAILLLATLSIFMLYGNLAFGQLTTLRVVKRDTVFKGDTIKTFLTDTTFLRGCYDMRYYKDTEVIDFFKPYFDKTIIQPGDRSNPQYIGFIEKAQVSETPALADLQRKIKTGVTLRHSYNLKDNDTPGIKNYTLKQVLVYRLSTNIVKYENGENLKDYYTLDTLEILYQIKKGNKIIGCTYFRNNEAHYALFSPAGSVSLKIIESANQQPLAFINHLKLDNKTRSLNLTYGYLASNGHIIFVMCNTGAAITVMQTNNVKKVYVEDDKKIFTAEAYFANSDALISRLSALINDTINRYSKK